MIFLSKFKIFLYIVIFFSFFKSNLIKRLMPLTYAQADKIVAMGVPATATLAVL